MPKHLLALASFVLGLTAHSTLAQVPDCRVLLAAADTSQHPGEIVVLAGTPVRLEVHCRGEGQPAYLWSTGQTSSAIDVNAPTQAGAAQSYEVDVTLAGATRRITGTVRVPAAGTPVCTVTRQPEGGALRVFTTVRLTAFCSNNPSSFEWSGGYDIRGQGEASVTHVNVVNGGGIVAVDVSASNSAGTGAVSGIALLYAAAPPACRVIANPPGRVAPRQTVTLNAECDGEPTSYSWAHGVTGQQVTVNPAVTTSYTLRASNAAGAGPAAVHAVPVSASAPGLRDYTGHWWGGTAENGWGITINQHGQALFGVIYFYDATGEPTWAVMPGGTWNADFSIFTADLYSPMGTPYTSYDASQLVAGSPVGSIVLTFGSPTAFTAAYRLGYSQFDPAGVPATTYGQKALQPLILNSGTSPSGLSVPDMWWGGPSQNGWGISVNQRSSEVFAAWFTYGADRRPTWFIVTGDSWSGNVLAATILRVTGSPWLGSPYDAQALNAVTAGQANVSFIDTSNGTFNYFITETGSGGKAISRQPF